MSIKFTVLLYSKYSPSSNKITGIIQQYSTVFTENFNIKLLCIDNENIRKRILSSKKITISSVPCILIIYNDGGVEKYENDDAFTWVNDIVQGVIAQQQQQLQSQQQQQLQLQQQQLLMQQQTPNEELIDENNEEEEYIPPPPVKKQQVKKQAKKQPVKKPTSNKTLIEDLEEIDDDTTMEFDNEEDPFTQVESTNALNSKRNDLLSLASEMQKSRDTLIDSAEKPQFPTLR
jgi:type II secretory pathway pseudopilin PulG